MPHDLSSLRSQLLTVPAQLQELLETFLAREPLLPGSLYSRSDCRCV